jgi:anti-sigma factor RsiW
MVDHRDVGAYALGLLERREAELAESHLTNCEQCARELVEFRAIAELLLHTGTRLLGAADPHGGAPDALQPRTLRRPGLERRHGPCH